MDLASFETLIEQNFTLFLIIMIWSLVWKGIALWRSAHREDKWWFIAILVFNTVGLLEIFYLATFGKQTNENKKSK